MFVSLTHVLLTAALAVSAFAVPDTNPTRTAREAYADVNPVGIATRSLAMREPLTNAQRLSRGLPPNRPRRAYGARRAVLAPRTSATPCVAESTGKIAVYAGNATTAAGYLSTNVNAFGEYESTSDKSKALHVTLCQSAIGTHDIYVQNGLADYPFLGLISGSKNKNDDLSSTSYNYAYVGGTGRIASGSAAVSGDNSFDAATGKTSKVESNVWSLDHKDKTLTPSWVNSDGKRVDGVIVHVVSGTDDSFVVTAGYSAYVNKFGPADVYEFRFRADSK
ncbi:hypothetical protein L226DRAFT_540332 [Lentinus tigrinus ALCF2SS1-7]|uniref:Uncharacterized protein n=1 Tax=Lentinus tigrinus ALCF2SS1-6 TaxID=1328759 RepID=A0A5C2RRS3_9APHY|nr:hypothetical protein L227DRAFT_377438 [Lentinus tigrinus ALCF2SS1-6]RPD68797.1 hypothetical protein L226DRAFT_540332 [Lentinus tigrinus ALCF2SS1-7]